MPNAVNTAVFSELLFFLIFPAIAAAIIFAFLYFSKKRELKNSEKRMSLHIASVAHDLRSPLTNIKGFADAIINGDLSGEKALESLYLISAESDRLARLSGRLCDTDATPVIKKSVFGICDVARCISLLLAKKAEKRGVYIAFSFTDDEEFYVNADKDAVFEAFYNICDNAVKYCAEGGSVYIGIENAVSEYIISVANPSLSTQTLSETDTHKYFSVGYRSESAKKTTDGFGLGLYVASNLISAHGKELSVTVKDGYHTFSFALDGVSGDAE